MKLTKHAVVLSGAFATLLAAAAIPLPVGDPQDGAWTKYFASGAYASDDGDRPEVKSQVSGTDLERLLSGSTVAVDNLGRVLEIEIETEHGVTRVTAKPHGGDARRDPGLITAVSLVLRSQAPAHR